MAKPQRVKFGDLTGSIPLERLKEAVGGVRVNSTDDGGWSDPSIGVHAGVSGSTGNENAGASGSANVADGASGHVGDGSVSGSVGFRSTPSRR